MATTIYSNAPSVTDGPNVYHTVSYDAVRSGTTINFTFYISSWLQYDASWIGSGKSITFKVTCGSKSASVVMKPSDKAWSKDGSNGSDPITGTISKEVDLAVTGVGLVTKLTVTTETIRSDGTNEAGVHSRTNSITIPAAVAPSAPSLAVTKPNTSNYFKNWDDFKLTATNNGTGSGSFSRWHFQFKRNSEAWTNCGSNPTTTNPFTDSPAGLSAGNTIQYRVGIENSLGQIAYSPASAVYTVEGTVTAIAIPVAGTNPVVNPTDSVTFTWATPNPLPQSGVKDYTVALYSNTLGAWQFTTQTALSKTVKPSDYGIARGQSLGCAVIVNSVAGNSSGYSPTGYAPVAKLPANVSGFIAASYAPVLTGNVDLAWGAASPGSGTLSNYEVEYAWKNPGGVWSAWAALQTVGNVLALQKALSAHGAYASFIPNTQLKYRVRAKNQYNLYSAAWVESAVLTILGGLMNKRIAGVYEQGLAYKKVTGTWRLALEVYKKITGTWRMGVG